MKTLLGMNVSMRLTIIVGSCLLVFGALTGCAYEKGFEYKTDDVTLSPLNGSAVSGTVVMGYGKGVPIHRMRIKAWGLERSAAYEVHLLDAGSCDPEALAKAGRIDASGTDHGRANQAWGFENQPVVLRIDVFGRAAQEFKLKPPTTHTVYGTGPERYPTVVIGLTPVDRAGQTSAFEAVACGAIDSAPTYRVPHT